MKTACFIILVLGVSSSIQLGHAAEGSLVGQLVTHKPFARSIDGEQLSGWDSVYKTIEEEKGDTVRIGKDWLRKGDCLTPREAVVFYDAEVRKFPEASFAYRHRGIAHEYCEEFSKAIADYTESLRLDPTDANVWMDRAITYEKLKDYENAL